MDNKWSTAATCTTSVAAGATHNVELIVDNGTTYPCTTSTTITVPAFPVASFTATTTYDGNPSNPYKSCEEREIVFKDLPGDDPTRRKPDITKAKEILNWEPKVSFKEGLQKTILSFKI